jgi:hypothetical protein
LIQVHRFIDVVSAGVEFSSRPCESGDRYAVLHVLRDDVATFVPNLNAGGQHCRHPEVLAVFGEPRRIGHKYMRPSFETPRKRAAPLAITAKPLRGDDG